MTVSGSTGQKNGCCHFIEFAVKNSIRKFSHLHYTVEKEKPLRQKWNILDAKSGREILPNALIAHDKIVGKNRFQKKVF